MPTAVCKSRHVLNDATTDDRDPLALLTVAEVAAFLKVSKEQVYRLCSAGTLPSVQLGNQTRRIRRTDLAAYIEERVA